MMNFGILDHVAVQPSQSARQRYFETLGLIKEAEHLGFHSYWLTEAHCTPEFSGMPSPLMMLSAAATVTARIKLGTAVALAPYYHPLRLFEDAAFLDNLSVGRLRLGLGRSPTRLPSILFDVDPAQNRDVFFQCVDQIQSAWHHAKSQLTYNGRTLDGVPFWPRPYSKSCPILLACNSSESVQAAAMRNVPIILTSLNNQLSTVLPEKLAQYRAACSDQPVWVVFIACPRKSLAKSFECIEASLKKYFEITSGIVKQMARVAEECAILGSSRRCIDKIRLIQETLGDVNIMFWLNPGGLIPADDVRRSMITLAQEIIPDIHGSFAEPSIREGKQLRSKDEHPFLWERVHEHRVTKNHKL